MPKSLLASVTNVKVNVMPRSLPASSWIMGLAHESQLTCVNDNLDICV